MEEREIQQAASSYQMETLELQLPCSSKFKRPTPGGPAGNNDPIKLGIVSGDLLITKESASGEEADSVCYISPLYHTVKSH